MQYLKSSHRRAFTIVELLISIAVLVIISLGIYRAYSVSLQAIRVARVKSLVAALANEQFEVARNLPYADVGLVNGVPTGKLQRFQTLVRGGVTFNSTTTIRNIDDSFDGRATGTVPVDTAPADYKLMAIEIGCRSCIPAFTPLEFTTSIAPSGLEGTSTNGSLFVKVFDATGQPIPDAVVTITNASTSPQINIVDNTDISGNYNLVDTPPGSLSYKITVTKSGYSTDQTYGRVFGLSTPVNLNKTVVKQQVTQASFAIDRTSNLTVSTVNTACSPIGSVTYNITGAKLLATSPNVPKLTQGRTTLSNGSELILNLEWDTYNLQITNTNYYVAGTVPFLPISVAPNSSTTELFILASKIPSAVLVSVADSGTKLPLSGVSVTLSKTGFSDVRTTGQGFWRQADWSGGAGQFDWANESGYFSSDGNVNVSTAGSMTLKKVLNSYVRDGFLISSSFDTGTSSNFYNITWQPQSQPGGAGTTPVRFQLAANNDNATWNFVGPDGTASTYYTSSNQAIATALNGNRYIRYKVYLHTDSTSVTPTLSEVALTFSSQCAPPGQVYFDDLSSGTYTATVSKTGYQGTSAQIVVPSNGYASSTILMTAL